MTSGTTAPVSPSPIVADAATRRRWRYFWGGAVAITALFALPLWSVTRTALHSEILSYILLVPFIVLYLFKTAPKFVPTHVHGSPIGAAVAGLFAVACWAISRSSAAAAEFGNSLAVLSYLWALLAVWLGALGFAAVRHFLFPIAFSFFMVPLPPSAIEGLSVFLQHASADVSDVALRLTGMPVFRAGLAFKLPGLTILVAEECSGIRSTLVLIIVSVLAGYLFLRRPWHRVLLTAVVLPLGVLRNAVRITSISWLTVNVDPRIIDSAFHHRGGPIFFLLSLIPLFLLLFWMRRREQRRITR